jgi:YD repeat-containing protein
MIQQRQPSLNRNFGWSTDNRLVSFDAGNTCQYNADGLLVYSDIPSSGLTRTLAWDGQNLLASVEDDAGGEQETDYTQTPDQYGKLISSHLLGSSSFYLFDALGSAIARTNASQTVVGTSVYRH